MVAANAQAICHLAAQNFKAFLMSLKAFKKNKSSFTGVPKIPGYNKKEQEFMIILNYQQCAIKDGMMRFPAKLNLDKIYVGDFDIAHVRIFPGKKKYKVEVVYKVESLPKKTKGNIAGIDLGLDNLATVAINKRGIRPLLINGRPLKSMNLYFNNKRDKVQSELKKCNDRYMSNKLETLYRKRNNRFNTYMHKASKEIIEYCLTREPPYYKRIIDTELSAYGDSNILIKFKVKTIIDLRNGLVKEYTCCLVKDELFEGKISFKVDDLAEAETVLQIMYLITEKLEEIKTNKKYKKEALNAD